MSRIGRAPVSVPDGVEVNVKGNHVAVKGPKGSLERSFSPEIKIGMNEGVVEVTRPTNQKGHRSLHGLTRALIQNMVTGVSEGFEKRLEIVGVGYRAALKGSNLELALGYSHPIVVEPPEGIEFEVPAATQVVVKGIDKQQVGQVAADIRALRKPEPYKGKGVRYKGEYVRRKVGKRA